MSDLRKLLDEGDEFERSLLDAAIDPEEERAREDRTLAALGLGGPVGPGPGDGGAAGGGSAAVGKWLAVAAVGGALVAGGIALRPRTESSPIAPPVAATAIEPAPRVIASAPAPPPTPAVTEAPAIATSVRIVSRPLPSASASPQKPTTSTLVEEIRALDRARAALRAGDRDRARAELDRYDREFPFGSLGPEARALRARVNKK